MLVSAVIVNDEEEADDDEGESEEWERKKRKTKEKKRPQPADPPSHSVAGEAIYLSAANARVQQPARP